MENGGFGLSSLAQTTLWLSLAGFAGAAALSLLWTVVKRFRKEDFRIGEDFGEEHAKVVEWDGKSGYVETGGELWRAVSKEPLAPGDPVKVMRADGLTLDVKKR